MQSSDNDEVITEINVTPLVDVCLVLVIIFMAVSPFAVQAGIKVLQSRSSVSVGKVSSSENVQVKINEQGRVWVNGKSTTIPDLFKDLTIALAGSRDKVVIVTADGQNKVKEVVTVLDMSKQAGASRVALMKNQ